MIAFPLKTAGLWFIVNNKGPRCRRDGSKCRSHPAGLLPCWLLLLLGVTLLLVRGKVGRPHLDFDLMPSGRLLESSPLWALSSASAPLNIFHTSLTEMRLQTTSWPSLCELKTSPVSDLLWFVLSNAGTIGSTTFRDIENVSVFLNFSNKITTWS